MEATHPHCEVQEPGEQRRKSALNALHLTIAGLVLNLIGASYFWISLPERMSVVVIKGEDHERRLRSLETADALKEATLARIDERTKAIQDTLAELKRKP